MLVYDITNEKSFDNIKNWIRNIEEVCMEGAGQFWTEACWGHVAGCCFLQEVRGPPCPLGLLNSM